MAFFEWKPHVSVAMRGAANARALLALRKSGQKTSPVVIDGRTIARTFWGKAWCDNLERYSDFANRLPRGRTYVRHGSVVDLQIAPNAITALVSGSDLYQVNMTVAPLPAARWKAVCRDCAGEIDSLIELLQGRLSKAVMERLCQEKTGLFPSPREITFTCSCPDWATMCKHVAAVLYGIGARLDAQPELLFVLRKVEQQDLIASGGQDVARVRAAPAARLLESEDLAALFEIDIAHREPGRRSRKTPVIRKTQAPAIARPAKPPAPATVAKKTRPARQAADKAAWRQAVSTRMKEYWAERRRRHKAR